MSMRRPIFEYMSLYLMCLFDHLKFFAILCGVMKRPFNADVSPVSPAFDARQPCPDAHAPKSVSVLVFDPSQRCLEKEEQEMEKSTMKVKMENGKWEMGNGKWEMGRY